MENTDTFFKIEIDSWWKGERFLPVKSCVCVCVWSCFNCCTLKKRHDDKQNKDFILLHKHHHSLPGSGKRNKFLSRSTSRNSQWVHGLMRAQTRSLSFSSWCLGSLYRDRLAAIQSWDSQRSRGWCRLTIAGKIPWKSDNDHRYIIHRSQSIYCMWSY